MAQKALVRMMKLNMTVTSLGFIQKLFRDQLNGASNDVPHAHFTCDG